MEEVLWVGMAAAAGIIARRKGRSGWAWSLFGLLFPPLALLLALLIKRGDRPTVGSSAGPSVAATVTSALLRGRMRETDRVKGSDCPIPSKPGVYHHINKVTRSVEYVGQTNDLRKRQQQHASSGKLDTQKQFIRWGVARDTATKGDLCQTEISHIARHRPSGNTTKGGNGRR